jgi:hypothetical protein
VAPGGKSSASGTGPAFANYLIERNKIDSRDERNSAMATQLFRCLRMNWLSGMYDWITFVARDENEARAITAAWGGWLPESLCPAQEIHPTAA